MRWGVRDEATDDHSTTELCLKEVKSCQQLSIGPSFVVRGSLHVNRNFAVAFSTGQENLFVSVLELVQLVSEDVPGSALRFQNASV